jgi:signal transduction histidine kinase
MTDMIESLLEFSRTRESLHPVWTNVEEVVRRAASALRAHPQWQRTEIKLVGDSRATGWFDGKKLERVFYNLLLNACEAGHSAAHEIEVEIRNHERALEIRVRDHGSGVPEPIRATLFQPFVSWGKENGTGVGLAVVQKIVQDHGGEVVLESTSVEGSVFRLCLPFTHDSGRIPTEDSPASPVRRARAG